MKATPEPYLSYLDDAALLSLGSMEGLGEPAVTKKAAVRAPAAARASMWPGYLLAAAVAALAYGLHYLPVPPFRIVSEAGVRRPLSAAIIAILAGVLARNVFPLPGALVEGSKGMVKKLIPITVVLTGAGLNLAQVGAIGLPALSITIICLVLATAAAYYFGRMFGLWRKTSLLIGAGTAICGTSAIVAVAPLIDADDEDLLLSIGTVNLLGIVLMFASPLVGGWLQLSDQYFGIWAGTSIHAVPQVVAAGFAFSQKAGTLATLVKLVRVTFLAPFVFVLAALYARRQKALPGGAQSKVTVHYARLVPTFVWGFLALALVNTLRLFPVLQFQAAPFFWGSAKVPLADLLVTAGNLVLALAMAAMGLEVNIRFLARVGAKAILTGTSCMLFLCVASLVLIRLLVSP